MTARRLILPAAMALVFLGTWYYIREPETVAAAATRSEPDSPVARALAVTADSPESEAPATHTLASVNKLVADTNSPDPRGRAAAIQSLAGAPREQALPALIHVLANGESGADRALALQSLRTLAIAQGDADGAVRGAFRDVISYGETEALKPAAREALDAVDAAEAR